MKSSLSPIICSKFVITVVYGHMVPVKFPQILCKIVTKQENEINCWKWIGKINAWLESFCLFWEKEIMKKVSIFTTNSGSAHGAGELPTLSYPKQIWVGMGSSQICFTETSNVFRL